MIIGTITLISMLFFGGVQEYFLLDKLEKGVKTYVEDKERRKEILVDLKASKEVIKNFNKDQKSKLKLFKAKNLDRNAQRQDFEVFFNDRQTERIEFQKQIIKDRLIVVAKFSQEEWDNIVLYAASSTEKRIEKETKKAKDPFKPLSDLINKTIAEEDKKAQGISLLEDFNKKFSNMTDQINSMNASENKALQNQMATSEELQDLANTVNNVRKKAMKAFIDFHFRMKEVTNEKEWQKIMKEFNKVLN